jgi:type II secretory pathway pseudopilin PulG
MNFGGKDGLTLTEVVIACAILGLTLSALIPSFVMQQKAVAFANNRLVALHHTRAVMEDLMTAKYYDSRLTVGNHSVPGGNYVVTENAGLKDIFLTMQWSDPAFSAVQSVTLATSLAYATHR